MHISGAKITPGMPVNTSTILGYTDRSGASAAASKGVAFGPHVHVYSTADLSRTGLPFGVERFDPILSGAPMGNNGFQDCRLVR